MFKNATRQNVSSRSSLHDNLHRWDTLFPLGPSIENLPSHQDRSYPAAARTPFAPSSSASPLVPRSTLPEDKEEKYKIPLKSKAPIDGGLINQRKTKDRVMAKLDLKGGRKDLWSRK